MTDSNDADPKAPASSSDAAENKNANVHDENVSDESVNDGSSETIVTPPDGVASHLHRIAELASSVGSETIARELLDERIPALSEGRLTMVVLGEFNHGKSTVINALLGGDVVPMGITPTTSVITHLVHGDGPAQMVFDDERRAVPKEALRAALTEDAAPQLRYVEIPVDSDFLKDGLVVVDTPGVNDISQQKAEITYGYVPRADVVVYVLDAAQALKKSEITFIRERLIRNSHDRLFFVLGKSDALDPDELREVRDHVERGLRELVGPTVTYPLSGRRARNGECAGFDIFREAITKHIDTERNQIITEGALRAGIRLGTVLEHSIAIESGALLLESDELKRRVDRVRERLSQNQVLITENLERINLRTTEINAAALANLDDFVATFREALPGEIRKAGVDDIKKYLPDFVHSCFKNWIEHEGTHIGLQLESLAEEIIEITNRNMREAVDAVEAGLHVETHDLNFNVDTFGYDVGVFAVGAIGISLMAFSNLLVGGALAVAAPILAVAFKGRVDAKVRDQAIEQGVDAVDRAGAAVREEIERMIRTFSGRLGQFVEDSGHRLYRQIAEVLDRVTAQRSEVNRDLEKVSSDLVGARQAVRAELDAMKKLRAGIGSLADAPPTMH